MSPQVDLPWNLDVDLVLTPYGSFRDQLAMMVGESSVPIVGFIKSQCFLSGTRVSENNSHTQELSLNLTGSLTFVIQSGDVITVYDPNLEIVINMYINPLTHEQIIKRESLQGDSYLVISLTSGLCLVEIYADPISAMKAFIKKAELKED